MINMRIQQWGLFREECMMDGQVFEGIFFNAQRSWGFQFRRQILLEDLTFRDTYIYIYTCLQTDEMSWFLPEQWSLMHPWLTQVSIEWYFCFEVCQDIRDLFNLTTSHMSTYMVVGTLFLGFSVSFMWSGIQSFPENPPWLKLLWVNCFISAMCYGFLVPGLNGWCGWCIGLFGCCLYEQDLQWNSTVARFADCNRTYISNDVIINIIPPNKCLNFRWRMRPCSTHDSILVIF